MTCPLAASHADPQGSPGSKGLIQVHLILPYPCFPIKGNVCVWGGGLPIKPKSFIYFFNMSTHIEALSLLYIQYCSEHTFCVFSLHLCSHCEVGPVPTRSPPPFPHLVIATWLTLWLLHPSPVPSYALLMARMKLTQCDKS